MAIRLPTIERPCDRTFDAMAGDERRRFCASCGKHVHDLSARTEAEARAFLAAARGTRVCVRYARDAGGTVRFRSAAVAAALTLSACVEQGPPRAAPAPPPAASDGGRDHDMGDAVIDVGDMCPDGADAAPNDDGCPEPEPVEI